MIGSGIVDERRPGDREISVLHWNVQWGGGLFRGPATWAAQRAAMLERKPDLIVLSEAPPGDWLDRLVSDLGPGASFVGIQPRPDEPLLVSPGGLLAMADPTRGAISLPGGSGMSVVAEVHGRPSGCWWSTASARPSDRDSPSCAAIAAACREADASGQPFDLVLGDFNTPSRSLGFDELEALGYRLAGRSTRGWRGTFPAWLPVYDIDHVWLARDLRLASCTFFNGPHTDHRGQIVRLLLPKEDRP